MNDSIILTKVVSRAVSLMEILSLSNVGIKGQKGGKEGGATFIAISF